MRGLRLKRVWHGMLCAAALALCAAPAAQGASSDPLFVYIPVPPPPPAPPIPPPVGYFNGPCGLGVDSAGDFYVSDYYHHTVDVFDPGTDYLGQLKNEDPLDGPCGLAFDSADDLYVNNYHRNVVKFGPSSAFETGTALPLPPDDTAHHLPTGVAVDPVSGNIYVDNRTYISVYDSSGAPVMDGADPLRIGVGSLGDGYGIALSQFPATLGDIYVPDASDNTVKVYDPAIDKANPVEVIDGSATPNGGFVSLRDAAVAVDRVSGKVYVVDDLQPTYTEQPNAIVYVFDSTGAYLGHLKYEITDALSAGLAVDNSAGATQGRVYVTSGNTWLAGVYAYAPGSETTQPPVPATASLSVSTAGSGGGAVTADAPVAIDCSSTCQTPIRSGMAVELAATPEPGSIFAGWSGGGCSGDGTCTVRMDQATSVSAEFETQPPPGGSGSPNSISNPIPAPPARPFQGKRPRHYAKRRHRHRHHHQGRSRPVAPPWSARAASRQRSP